MSYEKSASRIAAVKEGVTPDNATSSQKFILAIDSLEAYPVPFVPDGGTLQKDYDDYAWFEEPTFRYKLELNWDYERINAGNNTFDRVKDLITAYFDDNDYLFDFYIKYDSGGTYDSQYKLERMIPQIKEDTAGIIFENRGRQKPRSLMLESQSRDYTFGDVSFLYE